MPLDWESPNVKLVCNKTNKHDWQTSGHYYTNFKLPTKQVSDKGYSTIDYIHAVKQAMGKSYEYNILFAKFDIHMLGY